jgi:uncharacterized protein YcbK (DUF882 family)
MISIGPRAEAVSFRDVDASDVHSGVCLLANGGYGGETQGMHISRSIGEIDQRRRGLLRWLALGPAVMAFGLREQALAAGQPAPDLLAPRSIGMVNTHTGENLQVRYFEDGQYVTTALDRLHHLLRDHRSGESAVIDPRLFDQLYALARCAECEPHFQIISGYRSPASNAKLQAKSKGVATNSLHMQGRALDVRLSGTSCSNLRDLALAMQSGGVGYYARSDFVHLDTGRFRTWSG